MRKYFLTSLGVLILFVCWAAITHKATAQTAPVPSESSMTREQLEAQIQEKGKRLEELNRQLEANRKVLNETQRQKSGLQKDLKTIESGIQQLNLSIKGDQLMLDKLGYEISALNSDLVDIKSSMDNKRLAVGAALNQLQRKDKADNLLYVFLRNETLAEGVMESSSLLQLQSRMRLDIANLKNLHEAYVQKLSEVGNKKEQVSYHFKNATNKKIVVEDQKQERQELLQQTKNKESLYAQQIAKLKQEQEKIAQEIEALDAILRTKIDSKLLPSPRSGVLATPVVGGVTTQDYGATAFAQSGYKGKWHNGLDIGAPTGTPVVAVADGEVAASGNQDNFCNKGAYGKFVVIKHTNNLTSLSAHLSRYIVTPGQSVKRGDIIGYVGKTGYATGPHLHLTIFATQTFYMRESRSCGPMPQGGDLNPAGYL